MKFGPIYGAPTGSQGTHLEPGSNHKHKHDSQRNPKPNRDDRINPTTGVVKSWIDISNIHAPSIDKGANGIAYDAATRKVYVTGKMWDKMYEIKVNRVPIKKARL